MGRPDSIGRAYPFGTMLGLLLVTACGDEVAPPDAPPAVAGHESALEHAVKHSSPKYVCPMHPRIVRDVPGSCPICGMDLVERLSDPRVDKHPQVVLGNAVIQNMGVRTAEVVRGALWKTVRTLGRVEYDETRLAHVHPRAEGWIEDLSLRAEGEPVQKGQELAQLYAPDILSAQVDFLLAIDPRPRGGSRVEVDKARNLLRLLDVPDLVIREIERTRRTRNRIPVLAPIGGIVTHMMARDGMYVSKGTEMFTIADLSRVWILVDVLEHQIAWLQPGLEAEIGVSAHPGKRWKGVVDYLYPDLDPKTRTLRVRLVLSNPDRLLKPNMFAEVVIRGGLEEDVLKVPSEALIVTGERESVVLALGEGRFRPVDVVTGMRQGGEVEILSGLWEGDSVVVSGQFLIDSESSLRASFRRMSAVGNGSRESPADARPRPRP